MGDLGAGKLSGLRMWESRGRVNCAPFYPVRAYKAGGQPLEVLRAAVLRLTPYLQESGVPRNIAVRSSRGKSTLGRKMRLYGAPMGNSSLK